MGFFDSRHVIGDEPLEGVPVLGDDTCLDELDPLAVLLAMGIGFLPGSELRQLLFLGLKERGFSFTTVVHPTAFVSPSATLEEGTQVMAGAIVQSACNIGPNVIVNTGAQVDHHTTIGAHSHIAPGAVLCGNVTVNMSSFVGAGAIVTQGSEIEGGQFIKAGNIFHEVPKNDV